MNNTQPEQGKLFREKLTISSFWQQKDCTSEINVHTVRHIPFWVSNGQAKLAWSEEEEIGRQREKDGTAESRRLEGKGRKMKDPQSRWGDLCSHGLICPLIPNCVDRWVQSTLHCGYAKRGPQPTVGPAMPGFSCGHRGQRVCLAYHFTDREQCVAVKAPGKMLLFGHDSWVLWDFQNLPNRRQ